MENPEEHQALRDFFAQIFILLVACGEKLYGGSPAARIENRRLLGKGKSNKI
jgi:hypothetical protein